MLKLNNKGFVLVETLISAVFIMSIFSIIYVNFYPIMAEYEKRETYDDVDSKYATYWIKKVIQSGLNWQVPTILWKFQAIIYDSGTLILYKYTPR